LWAWVLKVTRTKSGLLKAWVEAGNRLPDPRRQEDFTLHLRLIEAAFFGDRHARFGLEGGNSKLENGKWKIETGEGQPAGADPAPGGVGATFESPVSNFHFPVSDSPFPVSSLDYRVAKVKRAHPELYQAVRNLAEARWQRLQVFARQAEKEAKDLREKLERAARGMLDPGPRSLRELWREARDRRLAQLPRDPIDEALWANFQQALEKAKGEKEKSEAGSQESEGGTQKTEPEGRNQKSGARSQESEAESDQSSLDNGPSAFPKAGTIGNPGLDDLRLQWRVERLIGVFLCSEAYHAFKAAEQYNRRVGEAFGALERALEPALQRLVG